MDKKASNTRIVGAVHVTNSKKTASDVKSVQSMAAKVRHLDVKSQKGK